MERSRKVIKQMIPCEPGWRILYAHLELDMPASWECKVIAWGLIEENDDPECDPRYEWTSVFPIPAPHCEEGYTMLSDGVDHSFFVALMEPGTSKEDFSDLTQRKLDYMRLERDKSIAKGPA